MLPAATHSLINIKPNNKLNNHKWAKNQSWENTPPIGGSEIVQAIFEGKFGIKLLLLLQKEMFVPDLMKIGKGF